MTRLSHLYFGDHINMLPHIGLEINKKYLDVWIEDNIIQEEANTIGQTVGFMGCGSYITSQTQSKISHNVVRVLASIDPHIPSLTKGDVDHTRGCSRVAWNLSARRCSYWELCCEGEDIVGACRDLLGHQLPNRRKYFVQIKQFRQNLQQA